MHKCSPVRAPVSRVCVCTGVWFNPDSGRYGMVCWNYLDDDGNLDQLQVRMCVCVYECVGINVCVCVWVFTYIYVTYV
jgi:hypothetical protein